MLTASSALLGSTVQLPLSVPVPTLKVQGSKPVTRQAVAATLQLVEKLETLLRKAMHGLSLKASEQSRRQLLSGCADHFRSRRRLRRVPGPLEIFVCGALS